MTIKQNGGVSAPDSSQYVTQTDGNGNLIDITQMGLATANNQITGSNYGNQANFVSGSGSTTGGTATTVIAAPHSGRLYITGVNIGRTDAGTTASRVTFNDLGATVIVVPNSGGGGSVNVIFETPLIVTTTTALTFTSSASLSTVYVSAQGYNAP